MQIGCLVMAAGNASRFGENKLAAVFEGKSLIERALQAVPQGLFDRIFVVTQYDEVEKLAEKYGFRCVRNTHPEWGISHTILLGTQEMMSCDAILYMVSDQPLLGEKSVEKVVQEWQKFPDKIVGAAHNGKRGNPCIFPQEFFAELMQLQGDCGGNAVIKRYHERLRLVEIEAKELADIDTPNALQELKNSLNR